MYFCLEIRIVNTMKQSTKDNLIGIFGLIAAYSFIIVLFTWIIHSTMVGVVAFAIFMLSFGISFFLGTEYIAKGRKSDLDKIN